MPFIAELPCLLLPLPDPDFCLQEYYYRLHNVFMRSATLKGILIHTADEAGPADGPDYQFG